MINADMQLYNYFTIGSADEYGQPHVPNINDTPEGQIKISINITSQSIVDNIKYKDASYIGLTKANVNDTYIIDYNGELLKVMYVNPKGRMKQVFMKNI